MPSAAHLLSGSGSARSLVPCRCPGSPCRGRAASTSAPSPTSITTTPAPNKIPSIPLHLLFTSYPILVVCPQYKSRRPLPALLSLHYGGVGQLACHAPAVESKAPKRVLQHGLGRGPLGGLSALLSGRLPDSWKAISPPCMRSSHA